MYQRQYISKFNTIIRDSKLNTGLNPIAELNYGSSNSRIMLYFDHHGIKKLIDDKVIVDRKKARYTLKITNSGSLDMSQLHDCGISSITDNTKRRATSFDLLFFLIPKFWDNGKGFQYNKNYLNTDFYSKRFVDARRMISEDGCNWYQPRNNYKWDEEGIYSIETLSKEYDNFSSNLGSNIIIGRQHFDIGNESISLDITKTVNKFIDDEIENYGIGIAFTPMTENLELDHDEYIAFLTNKTNLFFEPYVEIFYDDTINDDRTNFVLNKRNRLYLYSTIGTNLKSLDKVPTCSIFDDNGDIIFDNLEVHEQFAGVYYVDITMPTSVFKPNTMYYDTWSNIYYQGVEITPVELDFVTKQESVYFNIGNAMSNEPNFTPSINGIKEREEIKRGDIRKLIVTARQNYSQNSAQLIDGIEMRLFVMDGTREIDVIPWDKVHKTLNENYYMIDTNMLLPYQKYKVDIKITYNMQSIIHHDVLNFSIVDDLNNKYN